MQRNMSWVVVMTVFLATTSNAHAQGYGYPQGYGGYGWGGWGSTSGSGMARGLGAFNLGRGAYNEDTAIAGSINTNTVMNWNNYLFQSSQAAGRRYAAHLRAQTDKTNRLRSEIEDRVRNHPQQLDITDGDALNALLDVLLNPATADRSIRLIKVPLRHDVILDIPFECASEGMTICLDRMTMEGQWPLALRVEAFRPERDAVRKTVHAALEEDKAGDLQPATIEAVKAATDKLRLEFEKLVPSDSADYYPARDLVNALSGLTKMLYNPKIDQVLAELDDYQGTTLGDLLAFMQAFNLRFAPANSFRQRQIYLKLYPMLTEQVNGSLGSLERSIASTTGGAVNAAGKVGGAAIKTVEDVGDDAINGLKSAATDLFKGIKSW
jgi:hypothetical protein